MLLGLFCQPFLLNVLKVILNVHVVYLPTCPLVTVGQGVCLGIRATTAGVLMVVSHLWWGLGILGFTQDGGSYRPGRLLLTSTINPPFPV